MKKVLSLILVLVLCLSIVACGNSKTKAEKAIVGTWVCEEEEELKIVFNEDKTGILTDDGQEHDITWKYDAELECYIFTYGVALAIKLETVDGIDQFDCDGYTFIRVDSNYEDQQTTENNQLTDPSENKVRIVELTLDNWSEYLTFTSKYSVFYKESAFSDGQKEVSGVSQDFYFSVKDEYFSRLDTEKSTITVQISTDFGTQAGTYSDDYSSFDPNGEFTSYKIMTIEGSDFQLTDHGSFGWHMGCAAASGPELKSGELFKWLKDQQVLNITGTLYIAE